MSLVRTRKVTRTVVLFAALLAIAAVVAPPAFAAQNADIDQCANGPLSAPEECVFDSNWVNGNLGASKAHYAEDEVVPFRLVMTGLTPGAHTTTIEWDSLKGGKHAYDFIYNYNYT